MVWKHEVCETKWRPILKYKFLDSYLFCLVYKIFAVLYLRIRLFALLTAEKGNGTGVYAEISFPEFYNFFLFILFSFYFFFTFYLPTTFTHTHTHDLYPRHLATLIKFPFLLAKGVISTVRVGWVSRALTCFAHSNIHEKKLQCEYQQKKHTFLSSQNRHKFSIFSASDSALI